MLKLKLFSGGKGSGPADASKVKAFGPGLEKNKVQPGVPANFSIDSSKTGPASIDVDISGAYHRIYKIYNVFTWFFMNRNIKSVFFYLLDANGRKLGESPRIVPTDKDGVHAVTYLPPDEPDTPYQVRIQALLN